MAMTAIASSEELSHTFDTSPRVISYSPIASSISGKELSHTFDTSPRVISYSPIASSISGKELSHTFDTSPRVIPYSLIDCDAGCSPFNMWIDTAFDFEQPPRTFETNSFGSQSGEDGIAFSCTVLGANDCVFAVKSPALPSQTIIERYRCTDDAICGLTCGVESHYELDEARSTIGVVVRENLDDFVPMELCANPYSDCSSSSSMTTVCASSSHKRASLPLADITPKSTLMFSIQPKTYSSSELVHGTGAQEDEYSYRSDRIPRNTEMLKAELNMYTNVIMSLFALIPIMALLSLISTHSAIHTRCVEKKLFFGILLSLLIPINTAMGKIEYGDATSYGTSSGGTSGGGGSSNGDDGTTSLPINRQPHDWKVHEHDRAGYSNQQTTSRSSWVLQWIAVKEVGGGKLFEGAAAWYECENGYVLGGFERLTNNCQSLHCIQQMKCVTPAVPLVSQSCYVKDISLTFDNGGTVDCNGGSYDGYFIRGMWAKDNDWFECGLECWEKLRCCKYDETRLVADKSASTQDWWSCFDYKGDAYNFGADPTSWCLVDNVEYITGFTRSSGSGGPIRLLEEARVRKILQLAPTDSNPTSIAVDELFTLDLFAWKSTGSFHFYTIFMSEIQAHLSNGHGTYIGIIGQLATKGAHGKGKPLYRMYSSSTLDHFYTTNVEELTTPGYEVEGSIGDCFVNPNDVDGVTLVALSRYYGTNLDHCYSTPGSGLCSDSIYTFEVIQCYVRQRIWLTDVKVNGNDYVKDRNPVGLGIWALDVLLLVVLMICIAYSWCARNRTKKIEHV
eukprot:1045953_1